MTKKSKDDTLPIPNQHQSQKINPLHKSGEQNLLISVSSNLKNKKSIKKPQQLSQIQKVDQLKEKNHKLYKHAEKKIDRMIEIIDEISEKQLHGKDDDHGGGKVINDGKVDNDEGNRQNSELIELEQGNSNNINEVSKQIKKTIDLNNEPSSQQKAAINKTLTYLHNLLTYQKPLSHIKKEFQSFYGKLSAFSKQLESHSPLPQDKKFLLPENGLSFQQTKLVEQLIKQHYMRTGRFDVAALFDAYGKQEEVEKNDQNNIPPVSNLSNKSSSKRKNSSLSKKQEKGRSIRITKTKSPQKSLKKRPKVELIDLEQNFHQCFTLRNLLLKRQFEQPINWCVQQRLYETHSNPLQYELRLTQIKLLIKEGKYNLAYEKIQKDMVKFLDNYEQEINLLIGYLLFSCEWQSQKIFMQSQQQQTYQNKKQQDNIVEKQQHQLRSFNYNNNETLQKHLNQRYSKFTITQKQIQHLAQKFTHEYFIHYDISQFDTLEICYKVGKMYEQQYFDSIKMFSQKDREDFLKHRVHCQFSTSNSRHGIKGLHSIILPFEIPVDKQHLYHSIFVCPVTKEVLSSNDGVEFLSCGHLVSQSAKKSMAEVRRSNHKQKCPVCQKDRASQVVKVSF